MKNQTDTKLASSTSAEATSTATNNNVPTQPNPDAAITLVALSQDGGTANLATVLFPQEAPSSNNKTELSKEEKSSLERFEQTIERGLATFSEVGAALHQIQSQRLYRETHTSFEAYLAERWGFKRAHAYRMINSYRVLERIKDEDGKDLTESHVRQLARLPEAQRSEALRQAKELAGKKPRTAKNIQQAVDNILGKKKKKPSSKSADDEGDKDDGGGELAGKPTTPPAPTGGTTVSIVSSPTPMTVDTAMVNKLLELARETRKLLTEARDVEAAIQSLICMEHLLTQHTREPSSTDLDIVGGKLGGNVTKFTGRLDEVGTCVIGQINETPQLQAA